MTYQVDISEARIFLKEVIIEHSEEKELDWINQQEEKLQKKFVLRSFYLGFSTAPRVIRRVPLNLSKSINNRAEKLRKGFQPDSWNLLQCVRAYLLLMVPHEDDEKYEEVMIRVHETADMDEQVILYKALPLFPHPNRVAKRAMEGIRTNITKVFDAIALDNPFPKDFLHRDAWNQMVLKAVFMQRPLYRIYGADERANPELARMLVDFAHERWTAGRKVWPELWRFVGPFLNEHYLRDLKKVISGDSLGKEAGLLACTSSKHPEVHQLLNEYPEIREAIKAGRVNWLEIGKKAEAHF